MEAKAPIPDELEPPELLPGARWLYDAFWELSTDRQIGMAAGPIPASSIARETVGWPDDDAEAFRIAMREMDGVWLEHTRRGRDGAPDRDMTGSDNPARDAFRAAFR